MRNILYVSTVVVLMIVGLMPVAFADHTSEPTRPVASIQFAAVGEYPSGPRVTCRTRDQAHLEVHSFVNARVEVVAVISNDGTRDASEHWDFEATTFEPADPGRRLTTQKRDGHKWQHTNAPAHARPVVMADQANIWNMNTPGVYGYQFVASTVSSNQSFVGECFWTIE